MSQYESDDAGFPQRIVLAWNVSMPIPPDIQESQTVIPKEVTQAIGEIFVEYALAENGLRKLMEQLPEHRDRSFISDDVGRLEKYLSDILDQTPDEWLKAEFRECVKDLRSAFDSVNSKRNTLAHGQLMGHSSWTHTITASGEPVPDQPGASWLEISHPVHGKVPLTEPEISTVLKAAIELRRQVGILGNLAQIRNQELEDDALECGK